MNEAINTNTENTKTTEQLIHIIKKKMVYFVVLRQLRNKIFQAGLKGPKMVYTKNHTVQYHMFQVADDVLNMLL